MNDKELDAIRQTLQRIQRMASEPLDETDSATNESEAPRAGLARLHDGILSMRRVGSIAAAVLIVVGAGGMAAVTLMNEAPRIANHSQTQAVMSDMPVVVAALPQAPVEPRPVPSLSSPTPPLSATSGGARVEDMAQELLESGRVSEMRRNLGGLTSHSQESALLMARSYDPNYLNLIANPDAEADPAEAERWYRTWRDIASEHGLVMEQERFDRIIKAMR